MPERNSLFVLLLMSVFVSSGNQVQAVDYDHSYTPECLAKPLKTRSNGGQVINAELNNGLKGWSSYGGAKTETREDGGNKFIVALNRNGDHDSLSQKFDLEKEKFYIISAWLQVSNGSSNVAAVVKASNDSPYAGWSIAQSGCWSMFKGGIVASASGPAHLYFEITFHRNHLAKKNGYLTGFDALIEKARKSNVKIRAVDIKGAPLH